MILWRGEKLLRGIEKVQGGIEKYSGRLRNFHEGLKIIFLGGGGLDIFYMRG